MNSNQKDYKLLKRRQEVAASLDIHLQRQNALDSLLSKDPSRFLILLNGGYTGGSGSVETEAIQELFDPFNVQKVIMPLSKPYSFLIFPSEKHADEARSLLNLSMQWNRPIMLDFIHQIPSNLFDPVLTRSEEIHGCIPGLHYIPDFISFSEEARMLDGVFGGLSLDWIPLHYRKVKHYGYQFDYATQATAESLSFVDMPEWTRSSLEKYSCMFPSHPLPNQLTVNGYEPGDGIGPHFDSPTVFEPGPILILSLQSDIIMEFIKGSQTVHVDLRARSLLVMEGEARLDWKHAIRPRKADSVNGEIRARKQRASLTFRRVSRHSV